MANNNNDNNKRIERKDFTISNPPKPPHPQPSTNK